MKIGADGPEEEANNAAVRGTMRALLRTPVVKASSVMPDACPAGPIGTIPVGDVVVSEAIHPGMHSVDICCSMAITNFGSIDPKNLLDAVHSVTHFGPMQRAKEAPLPERLAAAIDANDMLRNHQPIARQHFATRGDGNHFAFVGQLKSNGDTVLVTHHGSRGLGARLYKAGMTVAERYRLRLSPETLVANA
jgi:RNA-splicing ligase RtcB